MIPRLPAAVLAALLVLCGCGAEESKKPVPAAAPSVRILPEAPTVEDCLQAVVSGYAEGAYLWRKNGKPLEGQESRLLCDIPLAKGDSLSVLVRSEGGEGEASVTVANSPPEIVVFSLSPEVIFAGVDIRVSAEARDSDGDFVDLRYRWAINGEVSFFDEGPLLPGERFRRGDRISLSITPFDDEGKGVTYDEFELTVPNAPPQFLSMPPASFRAARYLYEARAEDPDGDLLTYSLLTSPEGMLIDSRSGEVSWKIGAENAGEHLVKIEARDEEGLSATQEYQLNLSFPE